MTASIVPGAISWPWAISSESSRTTAAAASTASGSPSSVSTLPRRNTSQSRWPSSVRSTASLLPASSAATAFSSSICLRTHHVPVYALSASRTRAEARLPSARPPALAITAFITCPMSLGSLAPVSAIAAATIASSSASSSSAGR